MAAIALAWGAAVVLAAGAGAGAFYLNSAYRNDMASCHATSAFMGAWCGFGDQRPLYSLVLVLLAMLLLAAAVVVSVVLARQHPGDGNAPASGPPEGARADRLA